MRNMTIQAALNLLRDLRREPALRERLAALRPDLCAADLVRLGAERGQCFDEASLRLAFRHDWQMRMAHGQLRARASAAPHQVQPLAPAQQAAAAPG